MRARTVLIIVFLAGALGTVTDARPLVPIKAFVVNLLPIGPASRASAIEGICKRAYISIRFAWNDCYSAYTAEKDRRAQREEEDISQNRAFICSRLEKLRIKYPRLCDKESCNFWPSIYRELIDDMKWAYDERNGEAYIVYFFQDNRATITWGSSMNLNDMGTINCGG